MPKLSPEERRAIRAKLNELDDEEWFDNGELSEQEKAIIEARLDECDRNPGAGSSWEEAKARILGGLHGKWVTAWRFARRPRRMWRKLLNGRTSASLAWVRNS
jgi:putative addiction module component (TIGR02574 family)